MNPSNRRAREAVDRFLGHLGSPVAAESRSDESAEALLRRMEAISPELPSGPQAHLQESARYTSWRWIAVATILLIVAGTAIVRFSRVPPAIPQPLAMVIDGPVAILENGNVMHAVARKGATLKLADGTRVELKADTRLSVGRRPDGIELRLPAGNIIVSAAKQRSGRLYVRTRDCEISVVGTVFAVSAEEAGSRVSVLEGAVLFQQGSRSQTLSSGEQAVTNPAMEQTPIQRELIWSRNPEWLTEALPQPTGDQTPGSLHGMVVNSETGHPLPETTIFLQRLGTNTAQIQVTADQSGRFAVRSLAPGGYVLFGAHDGFWMPNSTEPTPFVVELEPGETLRDVRVSMIPSASISGRVIDDKGNGIKSLSVQLFRLSYSRGRPVLRPAGPGARGGMTDDSGTFQLTNVFPGEYYVRTAPDHLARLPFYYPGVVWADDATPVTVRPGTTTPGVTIVMSAVDRHNVRLKLPIGSPKQAPLSTVVVRYGKIGEPDDSEEVFEIKHSADDYTLLGLPRGKYWFHSLWMSNPNFGVEKQISVFETTAATEFEVADRDLDLGRMPNPKRISIPINVTFPGGRAGTFVMGIYSTEGPPMNVSSSANKTGPSVQILDQIVPGQYGIYIQLDPGNFVAMARYAGRDVLSEGLVVDGLDHGPIDILIESSPGTVDGVVRNAKDEAQPNVRVVLIPSGVRTATEYLIRTAATDKDGKFQIFDVPPGSYRAFAWESVPWDAYQNAEWMRGFETRGITVSVRKNLATSTTIRVIPRPR